MYLHPFEAGGLVGGDEEAFIILENDTRVYCVIVYTIQHATDECILKKFILLQRNAFMPSAAF